MRPVFTSLIALTLLGVATPAFSQEMIVTGQRRSGNDSFGYIGGVVTTGRPIITLRRAADYVVQNVVLVGDTRETEKRTADLEATLRNVIAGAGKAGVEIGVGDYVVVPLTLNNYKTLPYGSDGRPDTSRTTFLVKVRLVPGMTMASAKEQIGRFVSSVQKVGRSTLATAGEPTLSVVNPDQYRGQIVDLIAADAAASAAKFGPGYGVEVTGLDRPVEWARGGLLDVFLYLPSSYTVKKN